MSKFFLPILLVVGFILWKVLDYFALPNTFSILLIILTAVSGSLWCYIRFGVLPKRRHQLAREEQLKGKVLSEEEKRQILPVSERSEFLSSLFPVLAFVLILRSFVFEPFQIPSGSMEPTLRIGDFLIVEKYAYGIKDPVLQHTIIETGKPQRGDVIVFKAPKQALVRASGTVRASVGEEFGDDNMSPTDYIKRVVGTEGDRVRYDSAQRVISIIYAKNGQPCEQDCEQKTFTKSDEQVNPTFVYDNTAQLEFNESGDVEHKILNEPQAFNIDFAYYPNQNGEWIVPKGQYFVMGDNRDHSDDSRFWGFVPERNIVGKATFIWLSLDKKQGEWPTGIRTERVFTKIK